MAGATAERQETGVIKAVTDAVKKNRKNPVTVMTGKTKITGVFHADKPKSNSSVGSEPYTDVELYVRKRGKTEKVNLSLKGPAAPSLAGGGLRGMEATVPGIAGKFLKAVHTYLLRKVKLNPGDKVPDVFGKISSAVKKKLVIGTPAMGGPIHYMYIGPMNVVARYDPKTNILTLNGMLTEANDYATGHNLFFRLRARREDQRFDPDAKDSKGVPKIYGVSPTRGDSAGRIVVTDRPGQHVVSVV